MSIENNEAILRQRELKESMLGVRSLLEGINERVLGKKGQYLPIESAGEPHLRGELSWTGINAKEEYVSMGRFILRVKPLNITVTPILNGYGGPYYKVEAKYEKDKEEGPKNIMDVGTASNLEELKTLLESQTDKIKQSTLR